MKFNGIFTLYCILTQPKRFPVIPLAIHEEYCMDGLRQMRTIAFLKTITSQSNNFIKLSLNINSDYVEEDNAYIYIMVYMNFTSTICQPLPMLSLYAVGTIY